MGKRRAIAVALTLLVVGPPVAAQDWGGIDDELPVYGEPTPFIYVDGVGGVGEVVDGFGRAVIDASTNIVSIQTASGSFSVSFNEIATRASGGDPVRKALINAELNHVFRGGGVGLADGGMGFSNSRDSFGLTDYRDFCATLGCDNHLSGWVDNWRFDQKPPTAPPPPPQNPPPPSQECAEAFAEIVEARLAVDAADATCRTAKSKAQMVGCGVMVVYGAVRTSLAAERGAECVVPPPAPVPQPPGSGYWGWSF